MKIATSMLKNVEYTRQRVMNIVNIGTRFRVLFYGFRIVSARRYTVQNNLRDYGVHT